MTTSTDKEETVQELHLLLKEICTKNGTDSWMKLSMYATKRKDGSNSNACSVFLWRDKLLCRDLGGIFLIIVYLYNINSSSLFHFPYFSRRPRPHWSLSIYHAYIILNFYIQENIWSDRYRVYCESITSTFWPMRRHEMEPPDLRYDSEVISSLQETMNKYEK